MTVAQGDAQACPHPELGGHAVQLRLPVEVHVLAGVQDVEPGDPEEDRAADQDGVAEVVRPRIAIHADTGASMSDAPSQKWARAVNRFVSE